MLTNAFWAVAVIVVAVVTAIIVALLAQQIALAVAIVTMGSAFAAALTKMVQPLRNDKDARQ